MRVGSRTKTGNTHIPLKGNRGFTLVELLIVIIVGTAIMGAVVGLLFMFITNFEINRDYTAARQRGEMVFAILKNPLLQVSLGMPNDSPDFGNCFAENPTLTGLGLPLTTASNDRVLRIAYAVPSGIAADSQYTFTVGNPAMIKLAGDVSSLGGKISSDSTSTTGWVAFPSCGAAFRVVSPYTAGDSSITLISNIESGIMPFFDELHFVRTLEVKLESGVLTAKDPTTNETLGQVEGILDIFFEMDENSELLTASVLARGDQRNPDLVTPDTLPEWPGGNLTEEMRHYRVSVLQTSWRVRN